LLYLLDANTLIDAKRDYYPIQRIPEFWDWLVYQGQEGIIKIPVEIYEEFSDTKDSEGKKDELATWSEIDSVRDALLFAEEVDQALVAKVTYEGYINNPTDDDLQKIGRDSFLISYALIDPDNRCIVTTEVSKPRMKFANRKIPDVCKDFSIKSLNTFQLIKKLNFSTNWSK